MATQEVAQSVPCSFQEAWKRAERAVLRDRLINKGDLYFIQAGEGGPVKIGHARDIVKRLANMQANNHEELNCLARLEGRGYEETAWHAAFIDDCIRGEWHNWSLDLAEAIERARNGKRWWDHLTPPTAYIEDNPDDDPDEWTVDWHILLQLWCHEKQERIRESR